MTRLTDGVKTVSVEMREWDGNQWGPDFSNDFLSDCKWDEESEAWVTEDMDYTLDYLNDWKNGIGDFYDDQCDIPNFNPDNRMVEVVG